MINATKYFPNVEVCLSIWTILIQKKEILFVISVIIKPKLVCCSKNTSKQFIYLKWKEQNVKKEMKWRFNVITAVKCSWIQVSNFAVYIHSKLDITNLDIVNFAIYSELVPASILRIYYAYCIFHLIWWIIRYIEQKGSDRLVHYIKVWAYVYK